MFRNRHSILLAVLLLIAGCGPAKTTTPASTASEPTMGSTSLTPATSPTEQPLPQPSPTSHPADETVEASQTWLQTFEGPDYGALFDIVLSPDGNILAVGTTNHLHRPPYSGEALFMKLDLAGNVLWQETWGGDGYEQAWSTAVAEDGGYYVFGETDSYGAGNRDFFVLKVDADGAEEWFRTYGKEYREWPYGMLQLASGDLLVYGYSQSERGGENQYAVRVDPDGDIIWEYNVEGPEDELVIDALELAEGDLILAVVVGEDGELAKLGADGAIQWTRRYELDGWQFASQIAQTNDGDFLLSGFSMSSDGRRQADTWLARASSSGDLEWQTSFGEPNHDDYGQALIPLRDGTFLVGGLGNGILLTRVDEDGNILWRRVRDEETVYAVEGLIELEDGGFLAAGLIQLINGRSYDAFVMRTNAEGLVEE